MACKNSCSICPKLVISTAVAFTGGNLVITIPEGSYRNNCKYCIVVAQKIPDETTRIAPVVIQIGTGPVLYPVTKRNCAQLTACGIRTRTKYSTIVRTSADAGTFQLLGNAHCTPNNNLESINGDGTPAPEPTPAAAVARKGGK